MTDSHTPRGLIVLLPACTFPNAAGGNERETSLQDNISFLYERMPHAQILVSDNGLRPPKVPESVWLVHKPDAFVTDASIGECRNLLAALADVDDTTPVVKLHARCKLKNFEDLERFLISNPEFFLSTPNLWQRASQGYDTLPYIDTRVFAARAGLMRRVLQGTLDLLETRGGRMEQAMLAALLSSPEDCKLVFTRGPFFPVLQGISGHGRNYGSISSKIRSRIKALLFKLGL